MVRTQIQLTEGQAQTLKRIAQSQRISMAELIRRTIDAYLATTGELPRDRQFERALAVAGKYSSIESDVGRRHDHYLAEAYSASS